MSDLSILGGALGLGTPSFDPQEGKGYLTDLKSRGDKLQTEYEDAVKRRRGAVGEGRGYLSKLDEQGTKLSQSYDDVTAARKAAVGEMQKIVSDATNALLDTRRNRVSLPLLAAGSAMMMPSSTGGLGASLGAAGLTAAPYIAADRRSEDENTMRMANLRTLPLTMGEAIDKDISGQLGHRINTSDMLRGQTMRDVLKMGEDVDKDVASQTAQRLNVNEQQQGAVTRGIMTSNATGMKAVQADLAKLRKQAADEAKNRIAAAIRDGTTYEGDNAAVEGQLTEAIYAKLFKDRFGVWPSQHSAAIAGKELKPEELEKSVPTMPRSIPKPEKHELETYATINAAGENADKMLSVLDYAEPTGKQVPGMLSGPALYASRLAEATGLGGEWGKKIAEAGNDVGKMKTLMTNFALEIQAKQKGVATEGDYKRISESIANVTNTAELNKLMFSWMRSEALRARWQADVATDFVSKNKGRPSGIDKYMNDNGKTSLVRKGPSGAKVTLWDYVEGFKRQNPDMKREDAERKAIELWNTLP